ncbi:MAG: cysteine--tRNA ligase [Candidatus Altimarinota bacterium]
MKIYNSLSKKLEVWDLQTGQEIKMYLCGPTVYDLPHLGHGRSAVSFDLMRKYFVYRGFKTKFVSNYTDIEDKMIARAAEKGISVPELADLIIPEYMRDYNALGVADADVKPRATEYVAKMIEMIKSLAAKDIAYKLADGWYFDIKKFPDYGKLSGQNLDDLKAGARIDLVEGKRNPQDFVLWKFKKDGEPAWDDKELGEGRPGWHIECSAMIEEVFDGEMIDIHGGGEDLRFPHHECEIAQSESCFKHGFVKFWVHNAFVMVNNEKMSKSLNNFTTLRELFKTVSPMIVRFFYLQNHYRSPLDFHDQALEQAKNGLDRVWNFYERIDLLQVEEGGVEISEELNSARENIIKLMDEDFESGKVLTVIYELIGKVNGLLIGRNLSEKGKKGLLDFWSEMNGFLGYLVPEKKALVVHEDEDLQLEGWGKLLDETDLKEGEIRQLVWVRMQSKKNRDFAAADKIREFLKNRKIILEDGKGITTVKFS